MNSSEKVAKMKSWMRKIHLRLSEKVLPVVEKCPRRGRGRPPSTSREFTPTMTTQAWSSQSDFTHLWVKKERKGLLASEQSEVAVLTWHNPASWEQFKYWNIFTIEMKVSQRINLF